LQQFESQLTGKYPAQLVVEALVFLFEYFQKLALFLVKEISIKVNFKHTFLKMFIELGQKYF
jgi:hypothetical protein